ADGPGPAGDGPDPGDQPEALPVRLDPLADRPGLPDRGEAEARPRLEAVPGAPGRPAPPAAALPEDPRHLRQRQVPPQRGGDDLPVGAPRADRGAPAAGLLPGRQPDRAGLVAPA